MLEQLLSNIIFLSFIVLAISFLFVLIRLVRGPSLPDRVISLDMLGVLAIAFIAVYSIYSEQAVFLDAAIGLALVAFLGTVAFARFVETSGQGIGKSGSDFDEIVDENTEDKEAKQ